jgi:hypothetical protein
MKNMIHYCQNHIPHLEIRNQHIKQNRKDIIKQKQSQPPDTEIHCFRHSFTFDEGITPNSIQNKKKIKRKTYKANSPIFYLPIKHKNINKIIIINKNNTNTSRTLSNIFSFNISDLILPQLPPPWKIIFLPFNLNMPCGLGIINLANGREQSEKKITTINNNNTF